MSVILQYKSLTIVFTQRSDTHVTTRGTSPPANALTISALMNFSLRLSPLAGYFHHLYPSITELMEKGKSPIDQITTLIRAVYPCLLLLLLFLLPVISSSSYSMLPTYRENKIFPAEVPLFTLMYKLAPVFIALSFPPPFRRCCPRPCPLNCLMLEQQVKKTKDTNIL